MLNVASFIPLLAAPTGAESVGQAGGAASGSFLMTLIPMVLLIGVFYFFMIRPQNKKQKETQKMLNALKKGDSVVTIGGIHGVVSSVDETTVVLKVDEGCKMRFLRSAIASVKGEGKSEAAAADSPADAAK